MVQGRPQQSKWIQHRKWGGGGRHHKRTVTVSGRQRLLTWDDEHGKLLMLDQLTRLSRSVFFTQTDSGSRGSHQGDVFHITFQLRAFKWRCKMLNRIFYSASGPTPYLRRPTRSSLIFIPAFFCPVESESSLTIPANGQHQVVVQFLWLAVLLTCEPPLLYSHWPVCLSSFPLYGFCLGNWACAQRFQFSELSRVTDLFYVWSIPGLWKQSQHAWNHTVNPTRDKKIFPLILISQLS